VFAQLAQRMASQITLLVVHGMQEVSGSSPLSPPDRVFTQHELVALACHVRHRVT